VRLLKKHELVIIGAGPGGYVAAIRAAQLGIDTAIVEKEAVGGVCLNWGCIPTKALLKSAKVYETFKNAKSYGFQVEKDAVKIDFKKVMKRKERIVKKLTTGVGFLLKKNKVTLYEGEALVEDAHTIKVADETLQTDKLIIATGASPAIPPIDGLKAGLEKGFVLTSKPMLDIDHVPKRLVVVGGGVIGTEFATIFNSFGSEVTILEREADILPAVDGEVKEHFKKKLKKDKIKVVTNANVENIEEGKVTYSHEGEKKELAADKVLLAAGMRSNIRGLETLDLEMENGAVKTDAFLRTNVEDVYAIGDVNGKLLLAHVASKEGITAVEHMQGIERPMDYNKMPSGIYTFPEIAQVGFTEEEAKEKGIEYKKSVFPITANGKALAEGQSVGLVKIIAAKEMNEVIGVHILAEGATEMISEAVLGMSLEALADDIAHAVHPHPTLSEMVMEAAHGIKDDPIHI